MQTDNYYASKATSISSLNVETSMWIGQWCGSTDLDFPDLDTCVYWAWYLWLTETDKLNGLKWYETVQFNFQCRACRYQNMALYMNMYIYSIGKHVKGTYNC